MAPSAPNTSKPKWNYSYRRNFGGTFESKNSAKPPTSIQAQPVVKKKIFKEDYSFNRAENVLFKRPKRQTKNYEEVSYYRRRTSETLKFNCYKESDLRIGKEFSNKLIPQGADNDASTDDEQIIKATRSIYIAIRVALSD